MRVEPFRAHHLDLLNSWLEAHGENSAHLEDLPVLGFMVYTPEDKPIAAGFLRRCEGQMGIFDSLVTDPSFSSRDRHEALKLLVPYILDIGRQIKMTRVIAFTRHPAIIERAKSNGFEQQAHALISVSL